MKNGIFTIYQFELVYEYMGDNLDLLSWLWSVNALVKTLDWAI